MEENHDVPAFALGDRRARKTSSRATFSRAPGEACTVHLFANGRSTPMDARALAANRQRIVVLLAGAMRANLSVRTGRILKGQDREAVLAVGRPFMLASERERVVKALTGHGA